MMATTEVVVVAGVVITGAGVNNWETESQEHTGVDGVILCG